MSVPQPNFSTFYLVKNFSPHPYDKVNILRFTMEEDVSLLPDGLTRQKMIDTDLDVAAASAVPEDLRPIHQGTQRPLSFNAFGRISLCFGL